MALVCVPKPGKVIVKSAEHVSDVDADYNHHTFYEIELIIEQCLMCRTAAKFIADICFYLCDMEHHGLMQFNASMNSR